MKIIKLNLLAILTLFISSCDNSDENSEIKENQQSSEVIKKIKEENNIKNEVDLYNSLKTNEYLTTNNSRKMNFIDLLELNGLSKEDNSAGQYRVYGPFTANMQSYMSGSFNTQLTSSSGFATGIYNCRIRTFSHTVILPGNALPYANNVTPELYSNPYNQVFGRTESSVLQPNGTKSFTVTTKQLIIDYNILGQYIGAVLPYAIPVNPGVQVTYSYILI